MRNTGSQERVSATLPERGRRSAFEHARAICGSRNQRRDGGEYAENTPVKANLRSSFRSSISNESCDATAHGTKHFSLTISDIKFYPALSKPMLPIENVISAPIFYCYFYYRLSTSELRFAVARIKSIYILFVVMIAFCGKVLKVISNSVLGN